MYVRILALSLAICCVGAQKANATNQSLRQGGGGFVHAAPSRTPKPSNFANRGGLEDDEDYTFSGSGDGEFKPGHHGTDATFTGSGSLDEHLSTTNPSIDTKQYKTETYTRPASSENQDYTISSTVQESRNFESTTSARRYKTDETYSGSGSSEESDDEDYPNTTRGTSSQEEGSGNFKFDTSTRVNRYGTDDTFTEAGSGSGSGSGSSEEADDQSEPLMKVLDCLKQPESCPLPINQPNSMEYGSPDSVFPLAQVDSQGFHFVEDKDAINRTCNEADPLDITAECIANFARALKMPLARNVSLNSTALKISRLMSAPTARFRSAQADQNATDEILDRFDTVIVGDASRKSFELLVHDNLIVQTFNVRSTPVAGIVIYELPDGRLKSEPVYRNSTLAGVVAGGRIFAAAYLPRRLLGQIGEALVDPVVAITVFFKDSLFPDERHTTSGLAFGVLIPGFREEFVEPLKLVFRVDEGDDTVKECAHWLYGAYKKGSWSQDYTTSTCGTLEVCEYYHTTHFGMLVLESTDSLKQHKPALDTITLVGCCLSLVGIFGVLLTAMLFEKWRKDKGNVILANHAIATLLQIVVLYASDLVRERSVCDDAWCFWSGVLLHYVVLAQFAWVLVISYLQYKRYVQIFGLPTSHLVLKSCLFGWGAPLPFVLIIAVFFRTSYTRSNANLCYPSGLPLYLALLLPILVCCVCNLAVFVCILRSIYSKSAIPRNADSVNVLKLRLVLLLFFQLGLTWIFGFLSNLGVVFVYLFCLTATLQGFVVFLLFIAFNSATNRLYLDMCGRKRSKDKTRSSEDASESTRIS